MSFDPILEKKVNESFTSINQGKIIEIIQIKNNQIIQFVICHFQKTLKMKKFL